MRSVLKLSLFSVVLVLVVLALAGLYLWRGTPVTRAGVVNLGVTPTTLEHPVSLDVAGILLSSGAAVSAVSQEREGNTVVVVVRQAPVLPALLPRRRNGRFDVRILLTEGVDSVAFGRSEDVIWRR
jgi:hypothetical protein